MVLTKATNIMQEVSGNILKHMLEKSLSNSKFLLFMNLKQ